MFPVRTAGKTPVVGSLAAVAAFAFLAAGCGGGSKTTTTAAVSTTTTTVTAAVPLAKAAYVREMTRIGHGLSSAINAIGSQTSAKQAAAAYRKVQAQLRIAQKQLEAITPPAGVEKEHAALTKAVGDFADELGPIVTKIEGGDINAVGGVVKLKGYIALRNAAAAIVAAGYKIGA